MKMTLEQYNQWRQSKGLGAFQAGQTGQQPAPQSTMSQNQPPQQAATQSQQPQQSQQTSPPAKTGWSLRSAAKGVWDTLKDPTALSNVVSQGPFGLLNSTIMQQPKKTAEMVAQAGKSLAEAPIQAVQGVASGIAGLAGNEKARGEFLKPVNVPLLGEVKGISADPRDIEKYGTQTPLETGLQAADVLATGTAIAPEATKITKAISEGGEKVVSKAEQAIADRAAKRTEKQLLKTIEPLLSPTEKIQAVARGRGVAPSLFREAEIAPAQHEKEIVDAVKGVINPKQDLFQNIEATRAEINKEAESLIGNLKENNVPIVREDVATRLSSIEKPPLLAADQTLNNAYQLAQDKFMSFVDKEPQDISGMLQARKKFDGWVEKYFPNLYSDEKLSPLKQSLKDMRNTANDFIADKLPENSPFRDSLRRQHLMFEARDNMAEKASKLVGKGSKAAQFVKKYKTPIQIGGGILGGGALVSEGRKIVGGD